jgi:hypothetical protein
MEDRTIQQKTRLAPGIFKTFFFPFREGTGRYLQWTGLGLFKAITVAEQRPGSHGDFLCKNVVNYAKILSYFNFCVKKYLH